MIGRGLLVAFLFSSFIAQAQGAEEIALVRLLQKHCVDCHHEGDMPEGGLNLARFDKSDDVLKDRSVWQAVYNQVEARQMPPPKQAEPLGEPDRLAILKAIETIARTPDPALRAIDPGKPLLRRLTRLEYNNSVRDLLALETDVFMFSERLPLSDKSYFQPASGKLASPAVVKLREFGAKYPVLLPASGLPGENRAEHGYRNRGEAMNFSPLLLENYLKLASEIAQHPELAERSRVFAALRDPAGDQPVNDRWSKFLTRAFRRPVTDQEVKIFVRRYETAISDGQTEDAASRLLLQSVLASPSFLYLAEDDQDDAKDQNRVRPLTSYELASRLSYFLWSSLPDEELHRLAAAGKLQDTTILRSQVERMLRDPKARELSESFAVQWLRLDQLSSAKPDQQQFKLFYAGPQGKETLHGAQLVEALLLFETTLVENGSILDFIAADYTWLNPRLAKLYGIDLADHLAQEEGEDAGQKRELPITDKQAANRWHRVSLPDASRGGYLTMSAPLTVTSLPFRTSPVKRGAWLLETVFNRPPTEPKVAFAIENNSPAAVTKQTIRRRFEAHRTQAACFACHTRIDPPGFALESFDPIGAARAQDAGQPVDATGVWNGATFNGPAEFKQLLQREPAEFVRGFAEHLLSYALCRRLELYDLPTVQNIEQQVAASDYRLHSLIEEIALSYPFRHTPKVDTQ